jgi:protease YdgD
MFRSLILAVLFAAAINEGAIGSSLGPERHEVDIGKSPWSAIGRINNGGLSRCTGVLVDRRVALTAAHCLFNRRAKRFVAPKFAYFMLGYSRGRHIFNTTAQQLVIAPNYDPWSTRSSIASDWALLLLDKPAPETVMPITTSEEGNAAGDFVAVGYARDRSQILTHSTPCKPTTAMVGRALIVSSCDVPDGYSGGPLLNLATGQMMGLNVARGELSGGTAAVAIAPAVWRAALGKLLVEAAATGHSSPEKGSY